MTNRERLIDLMIEAKRTDPGMGSFTEYLADYLLANDVIVPPCKMGDAVYVVENPYTLMPLEKVLQGFVISIHLHEHGLYLRVLFDTKKINGAFDYNLNWKLNNTVFLTREEAEKALSERNTT